MPNLDPSNPALRQQSPRCGSRERRHVFATLEQLNRWQVPLPEALAITAAASENTPARSQLLALKERIQQGSSLTEALEPQLSFWGARTLATVRQWEPVKLGTAFHRLATGAAEPPLWRPFLTCFGTTRRRTAASITVLIAACALVLPVLPHERLADGSIRVLGHRGSVADFYSLLGDRLTWGEKPQWEGFREIEQRDPLGARNPGGIEAYARKLEALTGSRTTALCLLRTREKLFTLVNVLDIERGLAELEPSPVALVWLQRIQKVNALRRQLDGALLQSGPGLQMLQDLDRQCPMLSNTASAHG